MADPNELNPNLKVRDLIFAFEHQTQDQENNYYEEESQNRPKLKRTKSLGNALSYKLFRQPKIELYNILDIEKEVVKIETHLNYYEIYDKETHVAFQEQLFDILTSIVNIDAQGDQNIVQKKKLLIEDTQNLARQLNGKLPLDSNPRKVGRKVYTVTVKREEADVAKNQTNFAMLNQEKSTSNKTLDTDTANRVCSVNSKDKSALDDRETNETSRADEEENINKKELEHVEEGFLPSVKKLKAFFSFIKSNEHEKLEKIKTTNISRSSSMLSKTKYSDQKKHNDEENTTGLKVEDIQEDNENIIIKNKINKAKEEVYKDEVIDLMPVKESNIQQEEIIHSISVNKLKKLFEQEEKLSTDGLEIFSSTQPIRLPEIGVAFTAMNLGAFRLKRSFSGQYMNQIGRLNRNPLTSRSLENLASLPRKDSLVINKFGNIENEIDEEEEEERMPSLDYNGGMSSVGYDMNIPEPIKELKDELANESLIKPQIELYKEKVEFNIPKVATTNQTEKPSRNIPGPTVQVYDEGLLSIAKIVETNNNVNIEKKTEELMNILESTKSFSTFTSDSSVSKSKTTATFKTEQLARPNDDLIQRSGIQQKTHVTSVTSEKVHNLVTSFEKQVSESNQKETSLEISKENVIPAQHSPTSPNIVQSILYSIEKREKDSPTQIVEESDMFIYDVNEDADNQILQNHSVVISEVLPVPEIDKKVSRSNPDFENKENNSLNVQTYASEETRDFMDNTKNNKFVIVESNSNLENGVAKSESHLIIEQQRTDEKSAKSEIAVIQEYLVNGESSKVSSNLPENYLEHSKSHGGDIDSLKLSNVVTKSHNQDIVIEDAESIKITNKVAQNFDMHLVSPVVTETGDVKNTRVSSKVAENQNQHSVCTEASIECNEESMNKITNINAAEGIFFEKSVVDDIFNDSDLDVKTVDEEFEKLLQENV